MAGGGVFAGVLRCWLAPVSKDFGERVCLCRIMAHGNSVGFLMWLLEGVVT